MPEQPEHHPRRFGRVEEHGEVIPGGPVRPLGSVAAPERRCQCAATWSHGREQAVNGLTVEGPPGPCPGEMTGEDLLCDLCRIRAANHSRASAPIPDPCGYKESDDGGQ